MISKSLGQICIQRTCGSKLYFHFYKPDIRYIPIAPLINESFLNVKIKLPLTSMILHNNNFHTTRVYRLENEFQDKDMERQKLEKWIEMMRYEGRSVPDNILEEHIETMLPKNNIQRTKYLHYLAVKEYLNIKDKLKREKEKELNKQKREQKMKENRDHIVYGLWQNSMFSKVARSNIVHFCNNRLCTAMLYGQPLILDLGFDQYMRGREIESYAVQLQMSVTLNRIHNDPFNIAICNADVTSICFAALQRQFPSILRPTLPMTVSSASYLELFPKDKLVYLTPNAKEEMLEYDHDAIYIIGGIVDLGPQIPMTMAKAKKENIKMQKLPLDRYLRIKHQKSLAIHIMIAILLDVKETGDWKTAFQNNIPARLYKDSDSEKTKEKWNSKRRF